MKAKICWCRVNSFISTISALLFIASGLNVFAENSPVTAGDYDNAYLKANDTAGGGKASEISSGKVLSGKVAIVRLELQELEDIGPYLKSIIKIASQLYDEVTFQPVQVITQPTMIGSGTITNMPIGTEATGPPRPVSKQQLDKAIRAIKPIIDSLKKNVDEFMSGEKQLGLPDDLAAQLDPQFTEWVGLVNRISAQQIELVRISQNPPPYDNFEVAKPSLIMQKCAKKLDKVRLSIYKTMRKESKKIAAHRSMDD